MIGVTATYYTKLDEAAWAAAQARGYLLESYHEEPWTEDKEYPGVIWRIVGSGSADYWTYLFQKLPSGEWFHGVRDEDNVISYVPMPVVLAVVYTPDENDTEIRNCVLARRHIPLSDVTVLDSSLYSLRRS